VAAGQTSGGATSAMGRRVKDPRKNRIKQRATTVSARCSPSRIIAKDSAGWDRMLPLPKWVFIGGFKIATET